MVIKTVPYSEETGFSKLFRDYINRDKRILRFFSGDDFKSTAMKVAGKAYDRDKIADILRRQNRTWGVPQRVLDEIDRIKADNAIVIFTGQQACLFGGPYLILLKAIAAVKYARKLEKELARPVLPIFWIAADDHDVQEIAGVDVFDSGGEIERLRIDCADCSSSPPVGALKYDKSIARDVNRLVDIFPDNDFKNDTLRPIESVYRPGAKIVDCFARYLFSIMGDRAPIFFSPYDKQFKEIAAPFMTNIIDRFKTIKERLAAVDSKLQDAGYHRQVEKAETAAHLFFHSPNRAAIHNDGNEFAVDGRTFSLAELKEAISSRPLDFSPDVFTRPLMQSYVFPAAAIIGGPAEIAYYAQMMPLFDVFDLVEPHIIARPSLTIAEKRFEKLLDEYQLTIGDIAGDFDARITEILADTFPDRFDRSISDYKNDVMDGMERLREELTTYDPGLSGIVDQTRKKVDYLLNELAKKVFAAHKKKSKTDRDRLSRLRENLFPNHNLPERSIAPAYFISRYGTGIIDFVFENVRIDETGHQLLLLSDYNG